MLFNLNGCSAVLLLASIQLSLVSATFDNVEKRVEASAKTIMDCINVPWIGGLDRDLQFADSACAEEIRALIRGIESGETRALQMLEALLEIRRVIPKTNIQDRGTYDQSIAVNAQLNHIDVRDYNCSNMISPGNISVINDGSDYGRDGLHSSLDNETEVVQIVNDTVLNEPPAGSMLNLGTSSRACAEVKSKDLTMIEIFAIIVFLAVGAFLIFCTICDILKRNIWHRPVSRTMNTLSKFSLYTNALDVMSTEITPHTMPAIHGMRFLSCCSIVFGHRCILMILVFAQKITILDYLEGKNSWLSLLPLTGMYAVDTFLVISGFITSYSFFKWIQSEVKFSLTVFYLRRYFRMTPCLVAIILLTAVLLQRAGNGSLSEVMLTQSVKQCHDSWWLYLLHVQNLVTSGCICLPHGWYVGVDMQLFIISPLILYPLHRWPKFGLGILGSCLVASAITPAIILALDGYSNAVLRLDMTITRLRESFEHQYIPTYNRACPYLVGILLGYELAKKKRRPTEVNVAINWIIAGTLMSFCMWSITRAFNSNFAYDFSVETASAALSSLFWSIAVAWIIYATTQGYGGLATRFLSLPLFFPLSRLSYCIYLVHFGIQAITLSRLRDPPSYLGFEMLYGIVGDLVLSIAIAFIFHLFVESPFIVLIKILTNSDGPSEKTTTVQEPRQNEEPAIEI